METLDPVLISSETPKEASKSLVMNLVLTFRGLVLWTIQALKRGQYTVSFTLLRGVLERTISIQYYFDKPENAKQSFTDPNYNNPGYARKINGLGIENQFFKKVLSSYYEDMSDIVHGKPMGIIVDEDGGDAYLPEPFFNKEHTIYSLTVLYLCLFIVLGAYKNLFVDASLRPDIDGEYEVILSELLSGMQVTKEKYISHMKSQNIENGE